MWQCRYVQYRLQATYFNFNTLKTQFKVSLLVGLLKNWFNFYGFQHRSSSGVRTISTQFCVPTTTLVRFYQLPKVNGDVTIQQCIGTIIKIKLEQVPTKLLISIIIILTLSEYTNIA